MATPTQLFNRFVNDEVGTPQIAYQSPPKGNGTLITSITAANNSESNKSYKGYIVDVDGDVINPQRPFQIVIWADIHPGTGLDGLVIPPGGTLQFEASETESLFFTGAGIEM